MKSSESSIKYDQLVNSQKENKEEVEEIKEFNQSTS